MAQLKAYSVRMTAKETSPETRDVETERSLQSLAEQEKLKKHEIENVRTVLVVLSGVSVAFDMGALRHKISRVYSNAAVFFESTIGKPLGLARPARLDLLIDFTAPGQREGFFRARQLRRLVRFAVGRDAGWFRKKSYDRVVDESDLVRDKDLLHRERVAQRRVLEAVGVGILPQGDTTEDRAHDIALELPPLA